jgi:quercetin dioxygenase-like cupin family protein
MHERARKTNAMTNPCALLPAANKSHPLPRHPGAARAYVSTMNRFHAVLLLSIMLSAHGAEKPVPVRDEPYHKVILENDYVRVIDVQIPPGKTTLYHVHDIASVIVYLTQSTNVSQSWGETALTPRQISPGESRYAAYDDKALTHRVTNTGAGLFRVLDIELLRPAPAVASFPTVHSPLFQPGWTEKRVRSANIRLASGSRFALAANDCAHFVAVTSGAMKTIAGPASGTPREIQAHDFLFVPPQTRFELIGASAERAEAVLLELK